MSLRIAVMFFAVLAAVAFTAPSKAEETLPLRKAGLWELSTSMDEGAGPKEQTLKICVGDDLEKQTAAASVAEHKENCSRYEIKREGGTVTVDADCVYSQANVNSRTEMTGDFASAFAVKIETNTVRAGTNNQTRAAKRTIVQNGKYLGEACGDMKPGEAMTADGTKTTVQ